MSIESLILFLIIIVVIIQFIRLIIEIIDFKKKTKLRKVNRENLTLFSKFRELSPYHKISFPYCSPYTLVLVRIFVFWRFSYLLLKRAKIYLAKFIKITNMRLKIGFYIENVL